MLLRVSGSLSRLHGEPLSDYSTFSLSIYLSIDGHLSCFCLLAVVIGAALKTGAQISVGVSALVSLGVCTQK